MSIWCFNCCHPFSNDPVYLPLRKMNDGNWEVFGNFCSWECMKTYNRDQKHDMDKNARYSLISQFFMDMTGKHQSVSFSPARECLQVFGGNLDINTFRANNTKIDVSYYPFVHSDPIIESSNFHWTSREDAKQNFDTFDETKVKEEPLRLSRRKEKKTNQNTLEQSMGIFT